MLDGENDVPSFIFIYCRTVCDEKVNKKFMHTFERWHAIS